MYERKTDYYIFMAELPVVGGTYLYFLNRDISLTKKERVSEDMISQDMLFTEQEARELEKNLNDWEFGVSVPALDENCVLIYEDRNVKLQFSIHPVEVTLRFFNPFL